MSSLGPSLRPVSGTPEQILALLREWDAAPDPEPLVIATSGSTGAPKRVVLSRDAMRASALATHERLGGAGQWVLNLPPTYVAGVQVLYRSLVAGAEPVFDIEDVAAERSYISLVPTQLVRMLRDHEADLRPFAAVLLGGGPVDPVLREQVAAEGINVVATYGMSETCGGCVYDGVPLDGVEMRIGDDGEVLLRGPMLFEGYEGDHERTAAALRDGWFHTDDLGVIGDDGRLRVTGRRDDMIISGGVKVPASAVTDLLRSHWIIDEAAVVGVADEEWGERVVAFIVLADLALDLNPAQLQAAQHELEALFERRTWAPKEYRVVEQLPLLANGKPDRLRLRELE